MLSATTQQPQEEAVADTTARKIREVRMAGGVEEEVTKDQLLGGYLQPAFFANGACGIQVAAERCFSTSALDLNLRQSALLAGIVENPAKYDPIDNASAALTRRNEVLARMADLGYITRAQAQATEELRRGITPSTVPVQEGCTSDSAANEAFFCDYVMAVMKSEPSYARAYFFFNDTATTEIYTTLDPQDQRAAQNAVDWVEPLNSGAFNPGGNVDTEVVIQPGTGRVRAIAVDRLYGTHQGLGQTTVDYAVESQYDGGAGVQTGSSSKIFTLITALKQGLPFGWNQSIVSPSVVGPYFDCHGQFAGNFNVTNSEGAGKGIFTLYNGTTQSINVFFAHLEQKVGLCEVVRTAASMGMTFANGASLLRPDKALGQQAADDDPSFTLGSVPVAPMSMAAAYATVAAPRMSCTPTPTTTILTPTSPALPLTPPH